MYEKECPSTFKQKMRNLRNAPGYWKLLKEIGNKLGFPEKTTHAEIEATIIRATQDCFKQTLEEDIVLAALGLLENYDNRGAPPPEEYDEPEDYDEMSVDQADALVTERRNKFIKESSYIYEIYNGKNGKRYKGHYDSYEELARDDPEAMARVISTLGKKDGEFIDDVAEILYSEGNEILSYVKNHSDLYFLKYKSDGKDKYKTKLPPLYHTEERFGKSNNVPKNNVSEIIDNPLCCDKMDTLDDGMEEPEKPSSELPPPSSKEDDNANLSIDPDSIDTPSKKPGGTPITYIIKKGINFFHNKININVKKMVIFIVVLAVAVIWCALLQKDTTQKASNDNNTETINQPNNSNNVMLPSEASDSPGKISEPNSESVNESQNIPKDDPESAIGNGLDNLLDDVGNLQLSPGETFIMDYTYTSNDRTMSGHVEIDSGLSASFDETPSKEDEVSENSN